MCSMRKLMLRRVSTDCQLRSVWLWMPATPSSRKAWSYMAGESDREPPEPTQQARKRGADTGGGAVACSRCIFRRQRQQLLAGCAVRGECWLLKDVRRTSGRNPSAHPQGPYPQSIAY